MSLTLLQLFLSNFITFKTLKDCIVCNLVVLTWIYCWLLWPAIGLVYLYIGKQLLHDFQHNRSGDYAY